MIAKGNAVNSCYHGDNLVRFAKKGCEKEANEACAVFFLNHVFIN